MRKLGSLVVVTLFLLSTSVAIAEEPPAMPEPTPEHAKLGMWVGSWAGSGEMKSGPFGPGGPMSWTEDCSWFAGSEFHVVCKSKGTGPMGPMRGLGIMSYDVAKKVYTHYGVDSNGWSGYSEGTRSGDDWTFRGKETLEGKTYHSRFTMEMKSPTELTFRWEMSEDGENWTAMMTGISEKR